MKNSNTSKFVPILPVDAYLSNNWFGQEQEKLFARCWQSVGMAVDFKEPGKGKCVDIGNRRILVFRDKHSKLRAFHAHCKHRGMLLESNSLRGGSKIVCPYHRWTYSHEGELVGIPGIEQFNPKLSRDFSLDKASVHEWKGMVFVHADPHAGDFELWLKNLPDDMGPHRTETYVEYPEGHLIYELNANWKLFVENYMDGHHLRYLHAKTLNMYNHELQESYFRGPHWTFWEPLTDEYTKWALASPSEVLPELAPDKLGAFIHLLFPNLGIAETESWWSILHIKPLEPAKTLITVRTFWPPYQKNPLERLLSWRERKPGGPDPIRTGDYINPLESEDFMIEDMYVCEKLQHSMSSPHFEVGPLATHREEAITHFQKQVMKYMADNGTTHSVM